MTLHSAIFNACGNKNMVAIFRSEHAIKSSNLHITAV